MNFGSPYTNGPAHLQVCGKDSIPHPHPTPTSHFMGLRDLWSKQAEELCFEF